MIFTKHNLEVCLAAPQGVYEQWRDDLNDKGYRTISLSLCSTTSVPIYTAVMVKFATPFRGRSSPNLGGEALRAKIAEMAALSPPLHPFILTATGSAAQPIFAVAFREMPKAPAVDRSMTADEFNTKNTEQRAAGRIPLWMDSYGSGADIRYCAIWGDNPERIAWNAEALNDQNPERQQRFDALVSVGVRPSLIAMTHEGGAVRLFVDQRLEHSWNAKTNFSGTAIQAEMAAQAKEGRFPVRIGTAVVGGEVRYSIIFAKGDDVEPRSFRIRGAMLPGLSAANLAKAAKIDQWVEDHMRANHIRGAAFAVVEGTRLVFARGYTFAEPGYTNILPTTLFRMASVSKTYVAIAVWKLLANTSASRNSFMQDILGLTKQNGTAPGGDFAKVRIRHLLESCSGIDQGSVRGAVRAAKTATPTPNQPLTQQEIDWRIAENPMAGTPGGPTQYGRTDYYLLGRVAAKLAGVSGFDAALKQAVLDPLAMTRTRGSRSRIELRENDEARHQTPGLETGVSAIHEDRRLVPLAYGVENYEVYDGAGGVSSAMVDLARLCAMFSCTTGNPVLSATMLEDLFTDAVAATAAGSDHGYHGFDGASLGTGATPGYKLRKGGSNPGVRSSFTGETDRRFIMMARTDENLEGAEPSDWKTDLATLAADVDWNNGDLFPQYDMPAL